MTIEQYKLICDYLARYYDVQLYERGGIRHPLVNYPSSPEQSVDVDSVSGHLADQAPDRDSFGFYNYAYLHSLQNSGRNLFNGTTFVLKRLRTNPLRIDATTGKYFDMIATCIALEAELLDVFESGMIRLPMRTQYHRLIDAKEALTSGKGRSAAIGGGDVDYIQSCWRIQSDCVASYRATRNPSERASSIACFYISADE